jgi:hypothetical protein
MLLFGFGWNPSSQQDKTPMSFFDVLLGTKLQMKVVRFVVSR